jgi:hypothetical protein
LHSLSIVPHWPPPLKEQAQNLLIQSLQEPCLFWKLQLVDDVVNNISIMNMSTCLCLNPK